MSASGLPAIVDLALRLDRAAGLSALFAPPAARDALCALIAVRHEIAKTADVVSDPLLGEIRLTWWADALTMAWQDPDSAPRHEAIQPLALAAHQFDLPLQPLLDLIASHRAALVPPAPQNSDVLHAWLTSLEAPLLTLSCQILGGAAPRLVYEAAMVLGIAHWCRRLAHDRACRRLVLPEAEAMSHGLDLVRLIDFSPPASFGKLVAAEAKSGLTMLKHLRALRPATALRPALLPLLPARRLLMSLATESIDPLSPMLQQPDPLLPARLTWARWMGRDY